MSGFPAVRLHYYIRQKKEKQNNHTNYTQNPTQTLHFADIPRFTMCIVCALNYTQTIHKPYIEAFKTLHSECSQNYTRSGFEHESRAWNLESGWCEWYEWDLEREWSKWCESYVTFVTNVTYVTNVKQEMAIGGDVLRHSLRLFLSLTLCLFLSPSRLLVTLSRLLVTPARRSKNPTILSHFSAI